MSVDATARRRRTIIFLSIGKKLQTNLAGTFWMKEIKSDQYEQKKLIAKAMSFFQRNLPTFRVDGKFIIPPGNISYPAQPDISHFLDWIYLRCYNQCIRQGGISVAYSEMGITQTDEYQEAYDRFMEEYDTGKPVKDITADILEDYVAEFGADSGILHGVYYALAKCQWMSGGIHEDILEKVSRIITSGVDLAFFQELGADDRDLKLRKRNLDKFYQSLQVPKATVRRRKKPESAYVPVPKPVFPPMPLVSPGDLIAYPVGDQIRLFLVLNISRSRKLGKTAYCFVWEEKFSQLPEAALLLNARGILFGRVPGDAFPEPFQVVGKLQIPQNVHSLIGYAYPMWRDYVGGMAARESFYKAFPRQLCLTLDTVVTKVTNIQNGVR